MTNKVGPTGGLVGVTRGHLQTEEGKKLFESLLDAYGRGGAKEVRDLMKGVINQEKELRQEDVGDGETDE